MLHLKRYALWYMYVHSLCMTERMLTENKLIRDVFMFVFDLLACCILCLSCLAFFPKVSMLDEIFSGVYVAVCRCGSSFAAALC